LIEHFKTHTGPRQFWCKTCKKTFVRKEQLENHKITANNDCFKKKQVSTIMPYACKVCKKSFAQDQLLDEHISIAHKEIVDRLCNQAFESQLYLDKQNIKVSGMARRFPRGGQAENVVALETYYVFKEK